MSTLGERAVAFWRRFVGIARALEADFEDERALADLDDAVEDLGPYAWEIGPGRERDRMFALSPNGDEDLYRETQEIVALAPDVAGWEIHPARPPKEWDGTFAYGGDDDASVECDTRRWSCHLRPREGGKVDVVLFAPDLRAMDAGDRQIAAELAVVSWIGEVAFIERVEAVEVRADGMPAEAGIPLALLTARLAPDEGA